MGCIFITILCSCYGMTMQRRMGIENHLGIDLAKTAVSVAIAALSWRFVEQPILSLKDRFGYQRDAEAQGFEGVQARDTT